MLYTLSGVTVNYGKRRALAVKSLRIGRGERVALLGPNGSGKTSLLKLLDGLVQASEGTCERVPGVRSVYLHQYPYLLSGTVVYNVAFACRAAGVPRRETAERVATALALLRLEGMGRRSCKALSGGEAQRVALARALASGAEVLLLDEPAASADSASAKLIADALGHAAGKGATLIFSTHDEQFARRLCSRSIRLREGTIVEGGDA